MVTNGPQKFSLNFDCKSITNLKFLSQVPPRVLYPNNPRAAHNMTQFSYKERQYKRDDQVRALFSSS